MKFNSQSILSDRILNDKILIKKMTKKNQDNSSYKVKIIQ